MCRPNNMYRVPHPSFLSICLLGDLTNSDMEINRSHMVLVALSFAKKTILENSEFKKKSKSIQKTFITLYLAWRVGAIGPGPSWATSWVDPCPWCWGTWGALGLGVGNGSPLGILVALAVGALLPCCGARQHCTCFRHVPVEEVWFLSALGNRACHPVMFHYIHS